ncbi:MAG TPA: hypothetical protein DD424_09950 [Porphyromonadaceae bacterium]|nr:hypothetical protein [Porphyromonadaceae bacterium]
METLFIIALLASNVWFIRKVLTKPDSQAAGKNDNCVPPEQPPADEAPVEEVVGKSSFDADKFIDSFREIAKEAAAEAAREVVPLIVMELGKPSDAGLPDPPEEKPSVQIPPEKLDDIFSTHSVSELTGETPPPADANADGIDFEEMQTAIKVLKNQPHTTEDEQTARRVVSELEGTEIIEYVKLDPVVRKRILMIECQLPDIPEDAPAVKTDEAIEKVRKIVFHADIDTTDIDAIDFNILH